MIEKRSNAVSISIVIPLFNAETWIEETLESVKSQSFGDFEVIIVDDGSTDASAQIIKENFPWVSLVQTENKGCSAARSLGLELASASYVLYLDSDDVLKQKALEHLFEEAERSKADVVYGNWQYLNQSDNGWIQGEQVERKWDDISLDIQVAFFTGMWCPTSAYLWRREFLEHKHPGWHSELPVIQDARYALDAAMVGAGFAHVDQTIVLYRVHQAGSVSTNSAVSFAKDCFLNCREIWSVWRESSNSNQVKKKEVVLRCLEDFAYSSYEFDRKLSRKMFHEAKSIDSDWIPNGTRKRYLTARLLGVEASAYIFSIWHPR